MTQLVFLHGPGAGACSKAFRYQLAHFRGSLAPDLPGHPSGTVCSSPERYAEWVRGWLWAQGHKRDLVLSGYTMGANIALQYALDYPEEVKGLVLSTVALRPKGFKAEVFSSRLQAAEDPAKFEAWIDSMRELMQYIHPAAYREELLASHRVIGPRTQADDLKVTEMFDVRDRISTLKPKLLLVQGSERTHGPGDWEGEIHRAVPGSQLVSFPNTGHFPMIEQPVAFNRAVEEFIETLD